MQAFQLQVVIGDLAANLQQFVAERSRPFKLTRVGRVQRQSPRGLEQLRLRIYLLGQRVSSFKRRQRLSVQGSRLDVEFGAQPELDLHRRAYPLPQVADAFGFCERRAEIGDRLGEGSTAAR